MTGRLLPGLVLLLAFAVSRSPLLAQGLTVRLETSTHEAVPGQPFTVTLEVEGASRIDEAPRIESDAFRVLGSSKQTSLQIVNGRMSSSTSWQYTLLADRLGDHELGPVQVRADGRTVASNVVSIRVVQAPSRPTGRPRTGRSGYAPPQGGRNAPGGGASQAAAETELRLEVGETEVWVGQSILARTVVVSPYQISQRHRCEAVAPPRFDGFVPEELPLPRGPAFRVELQEGRKVMVGELTRHLLLATKPGRFSLQASPMRIPFQAGRRRSSLFDMDFDSFFDFPFGRVRSELVGARPVELVVRPLPEDGRPADFSAVVGRRVRLRASVDKNEVDASEAVTLRIVVEGEADLRSIKAPALDFGEAFKVYEPKATQKLELRDGRIWGQKSFEIVLVPRKEGLVELPVARLSYFDTEMGSYAVAAGAKLAVRVRPGEKDETVSIPLAGGKAIRSLGRDIRFIRESSDRLLADTPEQLHRRPLWWGILLMPWALLVLSRVFGVWQARRMADVAGLRASRALRTARKAVGALPLPSEGEGTRAFYGELRGALVAYVADKFDEAPAGLVLEAVGEALEERGVESAVLIRFQSMVERLQARTYAGAGVDAAAMEADRRELLALLADLERGLA